MADAVSKIKHLTIDEYMALADRHAEVVKGELISVSPNQRGPVLVARTLFVSLYPFAHERDLGEVLPDGATYLLDAEDRTDWVREAYMPDISFISRDRYDAHTAEYGEATGPWRLAPDLAIEVVSPSDTYTIISDKVAAYIQYGTRMVWVVDPQNRTVKVHTPDNPDGTTLHEPDSLDGSPLLPGWTMALSEVFGKKTDVASDESS